MTIKTFEDYTKHYKEFQWVEDRENGQEPLMLMGAEFQAHFVYFSGHTVEKRKALKECMEEYKKHFGDKLTWCAYGNDKGEWLEKMLDDPKMPSLDTIFQMNNHPDDLIQIYSGSFEPTDAPDFAINVSTNRRWQGKKLFCSFVQFRVLADYIFEPEKFKVIKELIHFFIKKLDVYHAVAGFQSNYKYVPGNVGDYALLQSERFWGIYQGAGIKERDKVRNGIKSIDWMTYISDTLAQRISDVHDFPKYCKLFDIEPTRLENGFLFQLDEFPQLVPSNEPVPVNYYNLNKALRPLRNGAYSAISNDLGYSYDVLDTHNTRLWMRRFDAPDIFPEKGHYEEQTPKSKIYLQSGERCEIDGIYRYDEHTDINGVPKEVLHADREMYVQDSLDDSRQHVLLLKDDYAPRYLDFYEHGILKEAKKIKWHLVSEIVKLK